MYLNLFLRFCKNDDSKRHQGSKFEYGIRIQRSLIMSLLRMLNSENKIAD